MSLTEIEYDKVNAFSNLLIDYNLNNSHFSDLISNFPTLDNLNKQISFKSKNYNNQFMFGKMLLKINLIKTSYYGNDQNTK